MIEGEEDLSLDNVGAILGRAANKLGFNLPYKMWIPTGVFAVSNMFSSEAIVGDNTLTFKFDPTTILRNEESYERLEDIKHMSIGNPKTNKEFAYEINCDENIVNAIVGHLNFVKRQVSVRKIIERFDKEGVVLNKMETNVLKINMPNVVNDYGNRPFDLTFSFD